MEVSERYLKAIKTAAREHATKNYDGKPYDYHLDEVEEVLREFGYGQDEDLIIAGRYHDIMEDCGLTKNDIRKLAGDRVANIVYLVTDHKGEDRGSRKPLEYYQALREDRDAIVIKLADRIANVRHSTKNGHSMSDKYKQEYQHFRDMLKLTDHAEGMWKELDNTLKYEQNRAIEDTSTVG